MTAKHKFSKTEVLMLERRIGARFKDEKWKKFLKVSEELSFSVKETKGAFLDREIDATAEEFASLLELVAEGV